MPAIAIRKGELEIVEKVLAAIGGLATALGLGKIGLALIGRAQHKDDQAFSVLQDQVNRLQQRVTQLETQGALERQQHANETGELRQKLAEANGERERLTILTVQQAALITELQGKVAEEKLSTPDPDVRAAARSVARSRIVEDEG